jgi:hypothetical protein
MIRGGPPLLTTAPVLVGANGPRMLAVGYPDDLRPDEPGIGRSWPVAEAEAGPLPGGCASTWTRARITSRCGTWTRAMTRSAGQR